MPITRRTVLTQTTAGLAGLLAFGGRPGPAHGKGDKGDNRAPAIEITNIAPGTALGRSFMVVGTYQLARKDGRYRRVNITCTLSKDGFSATGIPAMTDQGVWTAIFNFMPNEPPDKPTSGLTLTAGFEGGGVDPSVVPDLTLEGPPQVMPPPMFPVPGVTITNPGRADKEDGHRVKPKPAPSGVIKDNKHLHVIYAAYFHNAQLMGFPSVVIVAPGKNDWSSPKGHNLAKLAGTSDTVSLAVTHTALDPMTGKVVRTSAIARHGLSVGRDVDKDKK